MNLPDLNSIELVIESLMCELGIGGFMGMEDILPGMKLMVTIKNTKNFYGEVLARKTIPYPFPLPKLPDFRRYRGETTGNRGQCAVLLGYREIVHTAKELSNHFTINIESRPRLTTAAITAAGCFQYLHHYACGRHYRHRGQAAD